jgi:hypothetical protein
MYVCMYVCIDMILFIDIHILICVCVYTYIHTFRLILFHITLCTGDLDYHNFVCVEPGTVSEFTTVTPQDTLTLTQVLKSQ